MTCDFLFLPFLSVFVRFGINATAHVKRLSVSLLSLEIFTAYHIFIIRVSSTRRDIPAVLFKKCYAKFNPIEHISDKIETIHGFAPDNYSKNIISKEFESSRGLLCGPKARG